MAILALRVIKDIRDLLVQLEPLVHQVSRALLGQQGSLEPKETKEQQVRLAHWVPSGHQVKLVHRDQQAHRVQLGRRDSPAVLALSASRVQLGQRATEVQLELLDLQDLRELLDSRATRDSKVHLVQLDLLVQLVVRVYKVRWDSWELLDSWVNQELWVTLVQLDLLEHQVLPDPPVHKEYVDLQDCKA